MRILLLGKQGQLGWELQRALAPLGEVIAYDYPEIDLSRPDGIRDLVVQEQPGVIINATAYTAVDRAEEQLDLARAINAQAPGVLAEAARQLDVPFIHYSTDYVFDGTKGSPYVESDEPRPLGAYGQSKLEGEQAIVAVGGQYLILRTAWVYSLRRSSFVTKVLQWAHQQPTLRVVDDQVSNPTWARMLAEITALLLARAQAQSDWLVERSGLYHLAGGGYASRLEWAREILRLDPHIDEQLTNEILPAKTSDFPTPAKRPLYSALNCDRFERSFDLRLPDWKTALQLALDHE